MKNIYTFLCLLFGCLFLGLSAVAQTYTASGPITITSANDGTASAPKIVEWKIFDNYTNGGGGVAITIKGGAQHVIIRNCIIRNWGNGIDMPLPTTADATNYVTIDNVEIYNMKDNGIHVNQLGTRNNITSTNPSGILANHNNLIIKNCKIYNITTAHRGTGLYHGIYSQAAGVLIENNTIYDCKDGLGISQRSNGTIKRNRVWGCQGSGIGYYADHMYDVNNPKLWVFNNVVFSTNPNASLVSLQPCFSQECADGKGRLLQEFYVGFNTLVYKNATTALLSDKFLINFSGQMANGEPQDRLVKIYGNLLVNRGANSNYIGSPAFPNGGGTDYSPGNYKTTSNAGFKDFAKDDYRLAAGNGGICFANAVTDHYPLNDKDLVSRNSSKDAGAYEAGALSCPVARIATKQQASSRTEIANTSLTLYPNPATRNLTVLYTSQQEQSVKISIINQVVGTGNFLNSTHSIKAGPNTIVLDITHLSAGIYFLKIDQGNAQTVQKLAVIK